MANVGNCTQRGPGEHRWRQFPISIFCRWTRLSLATPGDTAIWRRRSRGVAVGQCVSSLAESAPSLANRGDLLILHLNQCACGPAASLGNRLRIGSEVEGNEEEKIRAENADTGNGSEFLTCALAHVREPLPVSRGEIGP